MRTYILSITDDKAQKRLTFRCEAMTFAEAMEKAEQAYPGFFAILRTSFGEGEQHDALHA